VVLNQEGLQQLERHGRNLLIKQLRGALYQWFDAIVLPRKWLFLDRLPLTAQGKIEQPLLMQLLGSDSHKFPQTLQVKMASAQIELLLRVPGDLVYFPDHFSSYPLLPGVVQIAWVEHFGKLFFILDKPFLQMEVIKFVKVIRPGDELTLLLDWKAVSGKLQFNFSSALGIHSSGRMVYGDKR
jgi:3-hydroxymyristoyl/3-hydroxydecanoyl-(acyl carrier protein) dehydratase